MTPEGHRLITEVLTADPAVTLEYVIPVPQAGQDIKEVTIYTRATEHSAVRDALGRAGLMFEVPGSPGFGEPDRPLLVFLSGSGGRNEYADQKAKS